MNEVHKPNGFYSLPMKGKTLMKTTAIVLAGGRGTRLQSNTPKQYMDICGYPLIYYCLKTFQESFIDEIVLVCGETDIDFCRKEIAEKDDFNKIKKIVAGGKERYHSVYNGLMAIDSSDMVFIHDGARPFVSKDVLNRCYEETVKHGACVAAVLSKDTVKIADAEGFAEFTPNRDRVWVIQTPQTFDFDKIKEAYGKLIESEAELAKKNISITDDAMVMEHFGNLKVKFAEGDYKNIKITTPEDMIIAKEYIRMLYGENCNYHSHI